MSKIQLRISDLRKKNQVKQTELANRLGVSVQTVSKWENDICMPDISLLPDIAAFFQVSVDELLGLKPLSDEEYIPTRSGEKDYWESRLDYLKESRKSFWNDDYFRFLVGKVWEVKEPVDILDCGCGFGFMGKMLLSCLPEGSTYTGIDFSGNMIEEGEKFFEALGYEGKFICDDFLTYQFKKQYDFVFSQCAMRHVNAPREFLKKMITQTKAGGMVVAVDVSREIECDGFYLEGMNYQELCDRSGFPKMWAKELACQGRDYAVGMRLPIMMQEEGLIDVDVRMNDKVSFVSPQRPDYEESVNSFLAEKQWDREISTEREKSIVQEFINHGMDRKEAESYCRKERKIQSFINKNIDDLIYLRCRGLLISYGRKKLRVY